jgi:hypothetical protein
VIENAQKRTFQPCKPTHHEIGDHACPPEVSDSRTVRKKGTAPAPFAAVPGGLQHPLRLRLFQRNLLYSLTPSGPLTHTHRFM